MQQQASVSDDVTNYQNSPDQKQQQYSQSQLLQQGQQQQQIYQHQPQPQLMQQQGQQQLLQQPLQHEEQQLMPPQQQQQQAQQHVLAQSNPQQQMLQQQQKIMQQLKPQQQQLHQENQQPPPQVHLHQQQPAPTQAQQQQMMNQTQPTQPQHQQQQQPPPPQQQPMQMDVPVLPQGYHSSAEPASYQPQQAIDQGYHQLQQQMDQTFKQQSAQQQQQLEPNYPQAIIQPVDQAYQRPYSQSLDSGAVLPNAALDPAYPPQAYQQAGLATLSSQHDPGYRQPPPPVEQTYQAAQQIINPLQNIAAASQPVPQQQLQQQQQHQQHIANDPMVQSGNPQMVGNEPSLVQPTLLQPQVDLHETPAQEPSQYLNQHQTQQSVPVGQLDAVAGSNNSVQEPVFIPVSMGGAEVVPIQDPLQQHNMIQVPAVGSASTVTSPEKMQEQSNSNVTGIEHSEQMINKEPPKPDTNTPIENPLNQEANSANQQSSSVPNQVSVAVDLNSRRFNNNLPRLEIEQAAMHSRRRHPSPGPQTDQPGGCDEAAQMVYTAPVLSISQPPRHESSGAENRRGSLPVVVAANQSHFLFPLYNAGLKSVDAGLDNLGLSQYASAAARIPFPAQSTRRRSADPSELYRTSRRHQQTALLGLARSGSASPNREAGGGGGDELLMAYLEQRRASSGSTSGGILSPVLESLLPSLSQEQLQHLSTISEMGSTCSLQVLQPGGTMASLACSRGSRCTWLVLRCN